MSQDDTTQVSRTLEHSTEEKADALGSRPAVGARVGHIRLLELLGRGGMGEVYAGFDEALQRRVAVKAIHASAQLTEIARARFRREARILSQLEHPNICAIHDYLEGDDRDFLVLELIEGKSLEAIPRDELDQAAALAIAIQIAEVLEVAHELAIVHRDLKPQNVMLTREGVVKVLDFGLARSAADEQMASAVAGSESELLPYIGPDDETLASEPAARTVLDLAPGRSDDPVATRLGTILGTPIYMSPEQARGEAATTASDMYSFGLLLQTLFGGGSPHPEGLTREEILHRAAHAETAPVRRLGRSLTELIERLKRDAPASRPTAVDALGRLRWIAAAPRRQWRRAVVVLALLIVTMSVFKYAYDVTNARNEATARQAQAESLLGFMLEDLRASLEPLGRLDLLAAVGDRAMEYFAATSEEQLSDEELSRQALALTQIGEVRTSQLRYEEAFTAFEAAYRRADDLSARHPGDERRLFERGQAEFWVGNTYYRRGDFDRARTWFERYLETCSSLLEIDPRRAEWLREVAYGHHNLAVLLMATGELDEAGHGFHEEIVTLSALLEYDPDDSELRGDLADAWSWLGSTRRRQAKLEEASSAFASSSRLFEELASGDPDNMPHRLWRALGRVLEAQIASLLGDLDRAAELLTPARSELDHLVETDPENRRWRRIRASAQIDQAELFFRLGLLDEAHSEVDAATKELEKLLDLEPTDRLSLQTAVRAMRMDGLVDARLGNRTDAERSLSLALEFVERLLSDQDPPDPDAIAEATATLVLLGELQAKRGDDPGAIRLWREATAHLGKALENSSDPLLLDTSVRAQTHLGRVDEAQVAAARLAAERYLPLRPLPTDGMK